MDFLNLNREKVRATQTCIFLDAGLQFTLTPQIELIVLLDTRP